MRTGFKTIAIDTLDLIAPEPGRAITSQLRDQRCQLVGTRADQGCRGVGLNLFAFVVDRDHRRPDLRLLRPLGRMDGRLQAKDHLTHQVLDDGKYQRSGILLLSGALIPPIKGIRPQYALQRATHHHRDRTFFDTPLKHVTEHRGLLEGVSWGDL